MGSVVNLVTPNFTVLLQEVSRRPFSAEAPWNDYCSYFHYIFIYIFIFISNRKEHNL
jgi:hypothetical protein